MANDKEVIREFLVSLGFQVQPAGFKTFIGGLGKATEAAGQVGKIVASVAVAAEVMVTSFANQMEKLYYASKRTKSSAENIQALEFGAQQIGVNADTARAALEGMAGALRLQPGLKALLGNFGINPNQDTTKSMIQLVEKLSRMPHYIGSQFATMFGIDEKTFLMLKENLPKLKKAEEDRIAMNQKAGISADDAAKASMEYMNSLRAVWEKVEVLGQSLSITLLPAFKNLSEWVNTVLDDLLEFRLLDMKLDPSWLAQIDAIVASWKKLNEEFGISDNVILGLKAGLWKVGEVVKVVGHQLLDMVTIVLQLWNKDWGAALGTLQGIGRRWIATMAGANAADAEKVANGTASINKPTSPRERVGKIEALPNVPHPAPSILTTPEIPKVTNPGISQTVSKAGNAINTLASSAFGTLIAKGEGDYSSVNRGKKGNYAAGKENLEGMTVTEVMKHQQEGDFNAAGRYQIIKSTLADAVKALGLKGDEKFDKGTQDKIFEQYLVNNKQKSIGDYISGKSDDIKAAMKAASKEWASVANPETGESYYTGVGNNKASISSQQLEQALKTTRLGYMNPQANAAGVAPTNGAAAPMINQTTNITVSGATNPNETARTISREQGRVNGDLVRNLAGIVS